MAPARHLVRRDEEADEEQAEALILEGTAPPLKRAVRANHIVEVDEPLVVVTAADQLGSGEALGQEHRVERVCLAVEDVVVPTMHPRLEACRPREVEEELPGRDDVAEAVFPVPVVPDVRDAEAGTARALLEVGPQEARVAEEEVGVVEKGVGRAARVDPVDDLEPVPCVRARDCSAQHRAEMPELRHAERFPVPFGPQGAEEPSELGAPAVGDDDRFDAVVALLRPADAQGDLEEDGEISGYREQERVPRKRGARTLPAGVGELVEEGLHCRRTHGDLLSGVSFSLGRRAPADGKASETLGGPSESTQLMGRRSAADGCRSLVRIPLATALLSAAVLAGTAGGAAATVEATCRPTTSPCRIAPRGEDAPTARVAGANPHRLFARRSFWNAPLPENVELDPRSARLVRELKRQVDAYGPWINTYRYSVPIYTVPRGQRRVRVRLDVPRPGGRTVEALRRAFSAVPVPRRAVPAGGSDRHMVIYQPAKDRMWEFWLMRRRAKGWHARWGGYMAHVSRNPGYFTKPHRTWGATATSLPLAGGLMRIRELQSGRIPHALALAIPETRARWYSWPAARTDGSVASWRAIPEGARFRLDPRFDTTTIKHPIARMMARAIQKYGLVVRDRAGAVAFAAEDNTKGDGAKYGVSYWTSDGIFGGEWPNIFLDTKAFPWHRLQLVKMRLAPER